MGFEMFALDFALSSPLIRLFTFIYIYWKKRFRRAFYSVLKKIPHLGLDSTASALWLCSQHFFNIEIHIRLITNRIKIDEKLKCIRKGIPFLLQFNIL